MKQSIEQSIWNTVYKYIETNDIVVAMATNITELTTINDNDFNTLKNKSILWDLMYQNGTFNDLSPDKFENVKTVRKLFKKNDDVRKDTI